MKETCIFIFSWFFTWIGKGDMLSCPLNSDNTDESKYQKSSLFMIVTPLPKSHFSEGETEMLKNQNNTNKSNSLVR